jgi:hypothetical protein
MIAVKVGKQATADAALDPLLRQGRAMARFDHSSVPGVLGSGGLAVTGPGYLLLEWIEGANPETLPCSGPSVELAARCLAAMQDVGRRPRLRPSPWAAAR